MVIAEAEEIKGDYRKVRILNGSKREYILNGEGLEWHRTMDDSIIRANKLKSHKLRLLQKHIKMYENIKFE
jgi:hypothetical protein